MASALINSAPAIAGITDPPAREKLVKGTIYPVARLLIGNDLADKLKLPKHGGARLRAALLRFRLGNSFGRLLERAAGRGGSGPVTAFGASLYDNAGLRYDMPGHVRAEESSHW